MRCGTSTLWEMLRQDPRIYLPQRKELHFFDNRDGDWDAGLSHYAQYFSGASAKQACGEITPSYLFIEEACARIHMTLPEVRLIAILRDPVARAWSHYCYNVQKGIEPLGFARALAREPQRLARGRLYDRIYYSYFARGQYAAQLARFEQNFGRDQMLVMFLDELKSQPNGAMARVLEHIGLDGAPLPDGYTLSQRNRTERFPRLRRFHGYAKRVEYDFAMKSPAWPRRLMRGAVRRANLLNWRSKPPRIPERLRERLMRAYEPADHELASWLGRSLPWRGEDIAGTVWAPSTAQGRTQEA